jgi:hypothetical protein
VVLVMGEFWASGVPERQHPCSLSAIADWTGHVADMRGEIIVPKNCVDSHVKDPW